MRARNVGTALAVGTLAALLAGAVFHLRTPRPGLGEAVAAQLGSSGVTHPVTAVLLNFRSYDTWLELIVLLIAAIAALPERFSPPRPTRIGAETVRAFAVMVIGSVLALAASYLLIAGAYRPGGAFQAGAMLAAALVLTRLGGQAPIAALSARTIRILLVLGAASLALAAIAGPIRGRAWLEYPAEHAGAAILAIEAAAMASIAVTLAALVVAHIDDPRS